MEGEKQLTSATRKVTGNPSGEGFLKSSRFKRKYEVKLDFPEEWVGHSHQKPSEGDWA